MTEIPIQNCHNLPNRDWDEVVDQSIDEFVLALQGKGDVGVAQSTINMGLVMMRAYDAADLEDIHPAIESKLKLELDWTPYARVRLELYAEKHPEAEGPIKDSIFFSKNRDLLRTLGRVTSARESG
jgi:hypothetical protein